MFSLNYRRSLNKFFSSKIQSIIRIAVLKMGALITDFEAGKVQINLLFMLNYLLHMEILPVSIFTYS